MSVSIFRSSRFAVLILAATGAPLAAQEVALRQPETIPVQVKEKICAGYPAYLAEMQRTGSQSLMDQFSNIGSDRMRLGNMRDAMTNLYPGVKSALDEAAAKVLKTWDNSKGATQLDEIITQIRPIREKAWRHVETLCS